MAKKITLGTTKFEDLASILGFEDEQLETKRARLFPLGNTTDENQTTSIFLSSLSAVKEYREDLLSELGITKIRNRNISLHVFTEVYNEEQTERPDGLIVLTSGKNDPVIEWICFVEAKVGNNKLETSQVERYIESGRSLGIEALITISNEITTTPLDSPIVTKKAKGFDLFHWSWTYLKVMSTCQLRSNNIADEDHVYILSELRRYFDSHRNISNFTNMGKDWKNAVQTIHEIDLSKKVPQNDVYSVASAYKQEEMDVALQLTDNTPYYVHLLTKKSETREESLINEINEYRSMSSKFYIGNDKNNSFSVTVGLIRKDITCQCLVAIEKGKAQAQTTALLKMLEPASTEDIVVTAIYPRNKSEVSVSLHDLYEEKKKQLTYSFINKDHGDTIKHFEITMRKELGRDMTGTRNFVDQLEGLSENFLLQVVRYVILGER